jgi:mannitol 2-dehydrogenase
VEALDEGRPHGLLTLVVAAWMRYLRGVDEQGNPITLQDDRAEELRRLANEGQSDPRPLLSVERVFGNLGQHPAWVDELRAELTSLDTHGARAVLRDV